MTGVGAGGIQITGNQTSTLQDLVVTAIGSFPVTASANVTLNNLTDLELAGEDIFAAQNQTLGNLTGAASASFPITGQSSTALVDLSGNGSGTVALKAASTNTLDNLTNIGSGAIEIVASSANTLSGISQDQELAVIINGSENQGLDDLIGAGTFVITHADIQCSQDVTLGTLTQSAQAEVAIQAQSNTNLANLDSYTAEYGTRNKGNRLSPFGLGLDG